MASQGRIFLYSEKFNRDSPRELFEPVLIDIVMFATALRENTARTPERPYTEHHGIFTKNY